MPVKLDSTLFHPSGGLGRLLVACGLGVATAALARPAQAQVDRGVITHAGPQGETYDEDSAWIQDPKNWRGPPIYDPQRLDPDLEPKRPDLAQEQLVVPERLMWRLIDDLSANRFDAALETAELLVTIAGDRPNAHYNHACVLSMMGKTDEAIIALAAAIETGWRHKLHLSFDTNLDNIRSHEKYDDLMAKLDARIEEERIVPRSLRRADTLQAIGRDLTEQVPGLLDRYHVPGASVAVVRDGKVWSGAFGLRDIRGSEAHVVDDRTVFRSPSAGRFTLAMLALRLEQRGEWSLDDPINMWLEESAVLRSADGELRDVTIRQVLNYTSGVRYRRPAQVWEGWGAMVGNMLSVDSTRTGTRYLYAPQAYLAVGLAIEKVLSPESAEGEGDGPKYPVASARLGNIFRPLRMRSTLAHLPKSRHPVAVGHTGYGTPYHHMREQRPDAPVYTSARDLAGLLAFLMSDDPAGQERAPLTDTSSLYETGLPMNSQQTFGFGLGVRMMSTPFGRCAEVADAEPGSGVGTLMRWYPDSGLGVVVLFNSEEGMEAARRIANIALGGV